MVQVILILIFGAFVLLAGDRAFAIDPGVYYCITDQMVGIQPVETPDLLDPNLACITQMTL